MIQPRPNQFSWQLFPTDLGWMWLTGAAAGVRGVGIGCETEIEARAHFSRSFPGLKGEMCVEEDWHPVARRTLQQYARGEVVDVSEITHQLPDVTPFQRAVLETVRQIPRGSVCTYGEVARKVGHPGAARAVGTTLARNPLPLIIPCHRVVGASGALTGFSAPRGVALKQVLLDLEQPSVRTPCKTVNVS